MNKRGDKVFTKDFIFHSISYFLLTTAFYFLLPTLPVYVTRVLGEDKSMVGYITGFYALSALVIRPFAGYAFDYFGRKPVYLFSLLAYTIIMVLYGFAESFLILIMVRLLHGLSWGAITTGGSTIVADIVPEAKRGQGIGYFGLSITLSMALGPFLGLYILDYDNFNRLFIISFSVALVAFIMAFGTKYPKVPSVKRKLSWDSIVEKSAIPVSLIMILVAVPYAGIMTFIPLLSEEIGVENGGFFFFAYAVGVSIFRPISGRIMDLKGPKNIMLFSFLLSITGLVAISFSQNTVWFLGAAFILGLGNGILMPTLQTMIINMVAPQRRGVANSTFFSAIDLGIGIGSVTLGYLAEYTSLSFLFLFSGILLLIPMFYFFIFVLQNYHNRVELIKKG